MELWSTAARIVTTTASAASSRPPLRSLLRAATVLALAVIPLLVSPGRNFNAPATFAFLRAVFRLPNGSEIANPQVRFVTGSSVAFDTLTNAWNAVTTTKHPDLP